MPALISSFWCSVRYTGVCWYRTERMQPHASKSPKICQAKKWSNGLLQMFYLFSFTSTNVLCKTWGCLVLEVFPISHPQYAYIFSFFTVWRSKKADFERNICPIKSSNWKISEMKMQTWDCCGEVQEISGVMPILSQPTIRLGNSNLLSSDIYLSSDNLSSSSWGRPRWATVKERMGASSGFCRCFASFHSSYGHLV